MAINAELQATEKLQLNAGFTYNNAEDSWDMKFTERTAILKIDGTTPLANGDFSYDDWELNNEIDSYSDLSYEQYEFTLGATYNFTDAFYTTVSGTYDIFESDEEYVYGDEDGKAYSGYLAFGYSF